MFSNFNIFLKKLVNKKIAFIGVGISNSNIIELLLKKLNNSIQITILDSNEQNLSNEQFLKLKQHSNIKFICNKNYLDNLTDFDLVVRSPGVYFNKPQIQKAIRSGVVITSELELFFNFCPCKIIAVTGSDGKTTTTSLIAEILKKQGFKVHLGGNIGKPLFNKIEIIEPNDLAVVEVSSFQLISMRQSPNIAIVTNISPNHLDVHKNMDEYVNSKLNLIKHQGAFDTAILNTNDSFIKKFKNETRCFVKQFSSNCKVENGAFFDNTSKNIYYSKNSKSIKVLNAADIAIPGIHNIENYLAAISAIFEMVSIPAIEKTAKNFKGVAHRLEFVTEKNNVKWFNDSIATTPTRTIAGLKCFELKKVILIAGGYDKKIKFDKLAKTILEKVKILILLGATAKKIEQSLLNCENYKTESNFQIKHVKTMEQAIETANKLAEKGDSILLSPACASFDMYSNFEERGLHFKKILETKLSNN